MKPDPSAATGSPSDTITVAFPALPAGRPAQSVPGGVANPDATVPYEFRKEIARGGMGSILEAQDRKLGRTVAVKLMLREMGVDAEQRQRFINEAAVLAHLAHPNIVPVYDIGRDAEGQIFYTMKLVHGRTLQAILNGVRDGDAEARHYTLDRLLTVFRKVCDALAFAHSRGIIHRDLKPENIMVGEFGEVLVMDWGLAKQMRNADLETRNAERGTRKEDAALAPHPESGTPRAESSTTDSDATVLVNDSGNGGQDALRRFLAQKAGSDSGMTMEGDIMGTPQYMSPEQAQGRIAEMDARSDIFSLGGILYAILTLRPPVEGRTADEVLQNVASGNITPPTVFGTKADRASPQAKTAKGEAPDAKKIQPLAHCPGGRVPAALSAVAMKALRLKREDRYQNVAALSADVEAYQTGFATSAEDAGAWKLFTLFVKRHKAASIGVVAVLLTGAILGTQALIEGQRAEREAVRANRALADLKNSAPAMLQLARSEADNQRFRSALEKLDAALLLDPALRGALWERTWLLAGLEKWDDAIAAYHLAAEREPAGMPTAKILPALEEFAAATSDADRWKKERAARLLTALQEAGATAAFAKLSTRIKKDANPRYELVQEKIIAWLGKNSGTVIETTDEGLVKVSRIPPDTVYIEPLRGLPIDVLSIADSKVTDLTPLIGMPLKELTLGPNYKLRDIRPLGGLRLESLDAGNLPLLTDIGPLRGMPLREVSFFNCNKITDFSPLSNSQTLEKIRLPSQISDIAFLATLPKLRQVEFHDAGTAEKWHPVREFLATYGPDVPEIKSTRAMLDAAGITHLPIRRIAAGPDHLLRLDLVLLPLSDLTPLRGLPVKDLNLQGAKVSDLEPLRGMPLKRLNLMSSGVSNLGPLRGMSITHLDISDTRVSSLEPLRGMPLVHIYLKGAAVRDVGILADFHDLEEIRLPDDATNVELLRKLPKLRYISPKWDFTANRPALTAEEFWKDFDAKQAGGEK